MRTAIPVKILGTGSFAPEKVLTNEDLSKMVATNDEWITARTGIKERHIAEDHLAASDMGVEAARAALEAANVTPEEIDMIVFATSSPDRVVPASAVYLQKKLGCINAGAVDNLARIAPDEVEQALDFEGVLDCVDLRDVDDEQSEIHER